MSVCLIVSAALLSSAVITAAAEVDNARAANAANDRVASAHLIIADNLSIEETAAATLPGRPPFRD